MFRRVSWFFVVLFALALTGATAMNLILINQARKALDEGILGTRSLAAPARHHLALVIPDIADSFFEGLVAGVKGLAGTEGVAVQIFRYRADDPGQAEASFQLCLTAHLDGVIFFGGSDDSLAERAARATAENVVFIPVGTHAPVSTDVGFIGSSSLLQGIESGNQAGQRKGRAARIGVILSSEGEEVPQQDAVYRGILVAIRSYPGAQIVRVVRAKPGILSGEEATSTLLKADPSINVLICASAPVTEGAAQVIVDQGRVGQVVLIGTDESPTINRLVDKGVIAASVVRDSFKMGRVALNAFLSARDGKAFREAVEVGFSVRTAGTPTP